MANAEKARSNADKTARNTRKKAKRVVTEGNVYVLATFNNTLITVTDKKGDKIVQASAGSCGFRGSRKSTPYAAQVAADKAGGVAREFGMKSVGVVIKGPGPGRESAIRAFIALGFKISEIADATPIPHNGCRPKKKRRV